jgi:hypothetical protein
MPEAIAQKFDISKTIIHEAPQSQTTDAVRALLASRGYNAEKLPKKVRLSCTMVLRLSSKKDEYYVVQPTDCTCPARKYHPGKPCKHMEDLFPEHVDYENLSRLEKAMAEFRKRNNDAIKAAALRELKAREDMRAPRTLAEAL